MKKVLILITVLSTIGLMSCTDINENDFYTLTVDFSNTELASSRISCPKSGKYKAGEKLEVQSHIIYDADLYVYLNENEVRQVEADGYWIYSFEMPAIDSVLYITMDQFYGKDEYTFGEIFHWPNYVKKLDDITKVRYEIGEIGGSIDKLAYVTYTEDKDDISLFYDLLKEPLVRNKSTVVCDDGIYECITYYIDNNSYSFFIDDKGVYWHDFSSSEYFVFKNDRSKLFEIANPSSECYVFSSRLGSINADLYYQTSDREWIKQGSFNYILSLEFIEYAGEVPDYCAYIDIKYFDKLYICSNKLFKLQNKAYEIIGNYDFSLIINLF